MDRRLIIGASLGLGIWGLWRFWPSAAPASAGIPAKGLAPPAGPMNTYHLGHSLVGRDMPAMLALIAGHTYASQLGWGSSLSDHWKGEIKGFAEENAHARHQPAREALTSSDFAAVVFTEMVELKDAIRWHDSAARLADWAALARAARPDVRLYLYETWHRLDDPAGWLERIDADLPALWEAKVLYPAMARAGDIYLIPAGQVMAAAVRAAEAGKVPGLTNRQSFFSDDIHLSDLGNWLVAMVHFAVLYHRTPVGLPAALNRADGTPATAPAQDTAVALQEMVWAVVTRYPATGVSQVPR